jgi:basic amino acid/polyamine antiporter, APA family
MVVACMVGTGVFTSVGFQVAALNEVWPILLLWLVGGILSLCGALCYAELVCMMPRSGGEYHLLGRCYHPLVGFLAGWISLFAGFAAPIALAAMAFQRYLQAMGLPSAHYAAALILLLLAVNMLRPSSVQRFLTLSTGLKLLLILSFLAGAVMWGQRQPVQWGGLSQVGSSSFAVSLIYVMFAYEGWNSAVYVAGEMEDPQRQLPRVLTIGTVLVTVLYLALNAVFLLTTPWAEMKGLPEAGWIAARHIFGPQGSLAMGCLIALGLISTVATMLYAGARVNERIGQDWSALGLLARRSRSGTPWIALLLLGIVALLLLWTDAFAAVQRYVESLLILSSCLVVLAVLLMRWRQPHAARPFRVPLYPLPPLLFLSISGYMLYQMSLKHVEETLYGILTLSIGAAIYYFMLHRDRSRSLP